MVDTLIQCDLCTNDFNFEDRIPKIMPNGHTFCLACAKESIMAGKCPVSGMAL